MYRRRFCKAVIAGFFGIVGIDDAGPESAVPDQEPFPPYHRFDQPRDVWVPIRKRDVRCGDHVWIVGDGVYLCSEDAKQDALTGEWTFAVCAIIDPATNEWVNLHEYLDRKALAEMGYTVPA